MSHNVDMSRPAIPAEIRRAVLVEAGHRCAIPRCGNTDVDIHHIIPWETCKQHEYSNLIALCPVCHRRAHKGEIDKKSLQIYKHRLTIEFGSHDRGEFQATIVEIKRRITETNDDSPGFKFEFDFPDFRDPVARIVSRNIEAWGYELLAEMQQQQVQLAAELSQAASEGHVWRRPRGTLFGSYHVIRRDDRVISIKYKIDRCYSSAVHRTRETRVQNFCINPFRPITIQQIVDVSKLNKFAEFVRSKLVATRNYDAQWLAAGTSPEYRNFSLFNVYEHGIQFTFAEYQIDCYAVGEQELFLGFYELEDYIESGVLGSLVASDR